VKVMKVKRRMEIHSILSQPRHYVLMTGQLHDPAAVYPGKGLRYPNIGVIQSRTGDLEGTKKLTTARIETKFLNRLVLILIDIIIIIYF
jgi:hypothetical protein